MKYSAPGTRIDVALEARDGDVVLSVSDRGVGIAGDDQSRIFGPFRRVGASQQTVAGVGLGLFVVKKIVDAHAGHVDVESIPGEGATFRVRLPPARAPRDSCARPTATEPSLSTG